MRGKPVRRRLQHHQRRIIPAHAGQTRSARSPAKPPPDHPRACGANNTGPAQAASDIGSSPRMRGKPMAEIERQAAMRIIPAHAGQTSGHPAWSVPGTDHPRACGANAQWSFGRRLQVGSSPRMRGKRDRTGNRTTIRRIIPAHAGQTGLRVGDVPERTDHPRACGANSCSVIVYRLCCGSSPRMRGKPARPRRRFRRCRIIPAHAGQTPSTGHDPHGRSDHPRACGANVILASRRFHHGGSSPRMRGKPERSHRGCAGGRIIPAHAGQTRSRSPHSSPYPDHPRACGANNSHTVSPH